MTISPKFYVHVCIIRLNAFYIVRYSMLERNLQEPPAFIVKYGVATQRFEMRNFHSFSQQHDVSPLRITYEK